MTKPAYFEAEIAVVGRDSDCFSQCQAAALLSFLQETGLASAAQAGLTRGYLLERYNVVWMLSRVRYTLKTPILLGDHIRIRSYSRDAHGMGLYRDFEILRGEEQVGEALALWMLVDAGSRAYFPIGDIVELPGKLNPYPGKKQQLRRLTLPEGLEPVSRRTVEYSQADMNGHLNNSRYADLICDAIRMDRQNRAFLSCLKISYLAECFPGDVLEISVLAQGDTRFVRGSGEDGVVRFEAEAELSRP